MILRHDAAAVLLLVVFDFRRDAMSGGGCLLCERGEEELSMTNSSSP